MLEPKAEGSEIFKIFFGGRYIIAMMGCFSIYTGLIYNDIFAKSFNIFGSHFHVPKNFTITEPVKLLDSTMLDPKVSFKILDYFFYFYWRTLKDPSMYSNTPYPMGIDPVWLGASNSIMFLNGYKMKISLIFGVIHMTFGVLVRSKKIFYKYIFILYKLKIK